jgi:16S rRNA (guanine(966)-N(2))-methyltransferase RsmD
MPKRTKPKRAAQAKPDVADLPITLPRIVGGHLRGRKLLYSGDPLTRPMKDRVREAVFNLVGPDVKDKHALDLFAGTGALGFEAISRGAARATFLERHFPTADLIRQTAAELGVADECQVIAANTFIWAKRDLPAAEPPWVVFVSPPWSLFREHAAEMVELASIFVERSPPGSMIVVEADDSFDFATLPQPADWDVREYPPAFVGVFRRSAG